MCAARDAKLSNAFRILNWPPVLCQTYPDWTIYHNEPWVRSAVDAVFTDCTRLTRVVFCDAGTKGELVSQKASRHCFEVWR